MFGNGWRIVVLLGVFGCGLVFLGARVRHVLLGRGEVVVMMCWGCGIGEWVFMYTARMRGKKGGWCSLRAEDGVGNRGSGVLANLGSDRDCS
jgi:hypothetical protein